MFFLTPEHLYILSKLHHCIKLDPFSYDCQSVSSSELTKEHDHFLSQVMAKVSIFGAFPTPLEQHLPIMLILLHTC